MKFKLKNISTFYLLLCLTFNLSSQNIYTLAGNGTMGYSGDGGPANLSQLKGPSRVAIDALGNLFIADVYNSCIRKITPSGIISTFAGTGVFGFSGDGGSSNMAQLNAPIGIAFDVSGNFYISDRGNGRIRKVNTSGIISTIAGTNTIGYTGDGGSATNATFNGLAGIAVDGVGNIYIADYYNHAVRKINTSGIITTIAGIGGTAGYAGDGGQANLALLNYPQAVVTDASGNVYISDQNHVIRKVNTSGIISTFAGTGIWGFSGDGGQANLAKINYPVGLNVDATGNIYFADLGNNRIRRISTSGIISTIAGTGIQGFGGDGGLAINAQFFGLSDVTIDAIGNIYICDFDNVRVRVICLGSCVAGINENSKSDNLLKVYPNPISSILNIETEQFSQNGTEIEIINCLGQAVFKSSFKNELDVSVLLDGIYTLQLASEDQVVKKRFVVAK